MTDYKPTIVVLEDADAVSEYVKDEIVKQIRAKPNAILTLPTGGTPIDTYALLVKAYQNGEVDFSNVTTTNLDEYWPIKKAHPSSYAYYMTEHLYGHVNLKPENVFIPDGEAEDFDAEAVRYRAILEQYPADLGFITLGPGETCHIGFNERGSAEDSVVRYVPLDDQTIEANARFFDDPQDVPKGAITQGVADILSAKRILFVATGEHKAWGLRRSLQGEINSDSPASFLRRHRQVIVIADKAAASLL